MRAQAVCCSDGHPESALADLQRLTGAHRDEGPEARQSAICDTIDACVDRLATATEAASDCEVLQRSPVLQARVQTTR